MRDPRDLAILALAASTAFLAGTWLAHPGSALAQQAPGTTGEGNVSLNNRMIAATGGVGSGMSVLWVVDTETRRVLVYGTNSLGKEIELRAARNMEWDLRLDEYHDVSQYKAEDLARLAGKQRQDRSGDKAGDKAGGEAPAPGGGK